MFIALARSSLGVTVAAGVLYPVLGSLPSAIIGDAFQLGAGYHQRATLAARPPR